jgi:hypothetical protein
MTSTIEYPALSIQHRDTIHESRATVVMPAHLRKFKNQTYSKSGGFLKFLLKKHVLLQISYHLLRIFALPILTFARLRVLSAQS